MFKEHQNQVDNKRDELIDCAIHQCHNEELDLYEEYLRDLEEEICQRFQGTLDDYYDLRADYIIRGYQKFIDNIYKAPDIEVERVYARVFGN